MMSLLLVTAALTASSEKQGQLTRYKISRDTIVYVDLVVGQDGKIKECVAAKEAPAEIRQLACMIPLRNLRFSEPEGTVLQKRVRLVPGKYSLQSTKGWRVGFQEPSDSTF